MKPNCDAYGHEIYSAFRGEGFLEITERDDGFVAGTAGNAYFAGFKDWPEHQKKAMALARGRVLDVGSGAGRVSLYLQERNHNVLAIDNSPLALKVCRLRGVRNTLKKMFGCLFKPIQGGSELCPLHGSLRYKHCDCTILEQPKRG